MIKLTASNSTFTEFVVTCFKCNTSFNFKLNSDKLKKWQQGSYIQTQFPELTEDERELLISGMCGKCFDKMFGEE